MKSQMNPGSIPIPGGDTKVENPDGVSITFDNGNDQRHSAYDAKFFSNGCSYGAFNREGSGPFIMMDEPTVETTRRKGS